MSVGLSAQEGRDLDPLLFRVHIRFILIDLRSAWCLLLAKLRGLVP